MGYAGAWNIDQSRGAREQCRRMSISPSPITGAGRWHGAERPRARLVDAEEFAAGHALRPAKPLKRKLTADDVAEA